MSHENKENSSATATNSETGKPAESGHNADVDESTEEEVKHTQVEEEVEEIKEAEQDDADHGANEAGGIHIEQQFPALYTELLSLPPHGSQVYIGGIPPDTSTEDLKAFCEHNIGEVTQVRLLKQKDPSKNREYCFVTFRSVELASKAMDELNGAEFKGKNIRCSNSQENNRLFIGNVPRRWGEEDLRKVVTEVGPGVTNVELVEDMNSTYNNRGFAFVDYYNHSCADYSRQKMMDPKFKLGHNAPTVNWAVRSSSAEYQVKALYVTNVPENVTEDQLRKLFEHHGTIINVVIPPAKSGEEKSRFGFVHFAQRSSAMKALKNNERYELDGQILECEIAKPWAAHKYGVSNTQKSELLPSYPPYLSYGLAGGSYHALGAGYGAAVHAQPLIYATGPSLTGIAMIPMYFPDGRIGYAVQQPGVQPQTPPSYQRGGTSGGGESGSEDVGSSSMGGHNSDSGQGHGYHPY